MLGHAGAGTSLLLAPCPQEHHRGGVTPSQGTLISVSPWKVIFAFECTLHIVQYVLRVCFSEPYIILQISVPLSTAEGAAGAAPEDAVLGDASNKDAAST